MQNPQRERKQTFRLLIFSFVIVFLCLDTHAVEDPVFQHIVEDSTEQISYINAIAQDKYDYIWFGGNNGLARFDGYELKIYRAQTDSAAGLLSSKVHELLVTSNGDMWVATSTALHRYDPHRDLFIPYQNLDGSGASDARNEVRAMLEDRQGRLWLGTSSGVYIFSTADGSFTPVSLSSQNRGSFSLPVVWALAEDQQGYIWVATYKSGVLSISPDLDEIQNYSKDPKNIDSIGDNDIRSLLIDDKNNLWAGSHSGNLYLMGPSRDAFYTFDPIGDLKDAIWSIHQDAQGDIWVGNGRGLHLYNKASNNFTTFRNDKENPSSLGGIAVRKIFEDKVGDLWFGFFPSGVTKLDRQASAFNNIMPDKKNSRSIIGGGIASIAEDEKGNFWIGSGWGLSYYDRATRDATQYYHEPGNTNSIAGNSVLSLLLDSAGDLWVGTWTKGVSRYDRATHTYSHYFPEDANANSLIGTEIWHIMEDSNHDIWFATELGVCRYNRKTGDFTRFEPSVDQMFGSNHLYTRLVYEDKNHNIWMGAESGLYLLDRLSGAFTSFHKNDQGNGLPVNFIRVIFEDSKGRFWLGTHGGGLCLFDRNLGTCTLYGLEEGLSDLVVTGIVEDKAGILWITTQRGLTRYSPEKNQFKVFYKRHGLSSNAFNRNTPLISRQGEVVVGSIEGLTSFFPDKLSENHHVPSVRITDFSIFNDKIYASADGPLQQPIALAKRVTLRHDQSFFSFRFAALNYRYPDDNQYHYRMVGFNDGWIDIGNQRTATYTNLDPGSYTFEVKGSNNDLVWNENPTSLEVIILPPWWNTWWAKAVMLFWGVGLLYWLYRIQQRKLELDNEKSVNAKLLKLDKIKDAFLANTSHELRTPLNGIVGLADNLIATAIDKLDAEESNKLILISKSGKRLANLINDILDYSKMASKTLEVKLSATNIFTVANAVVSILNPIVKNNVTLVNAVEKDAPLIWADENRLQQILINIVGNAIKYTDKGVIEISGFADDDRYVIAVKDTGIGMRPEDLKHIFTAFRQLDDEDGRRYSGTGLGLAITKQLVEIQGGTVAVDSSLGNGSEFRVTLQLAKTGSKETVVTGVGLGSKDAAIRIDSPECQQNLIAKDAVIADAHSSPPHKMRKPDGRHKGSSFTVLIVDDDAVNRIVLTGILKLNSYNIIEAESGFEALEIVSNTSNLDLVILDVMMPRMSGFEVCREIRKTRPIHELPILFLSAKNSDDDLKTGFGAGGNEFITKPVAKEDLLPRIENHLNMLSILRDYKRRAERE